MKSRSEILKLVQAKIRLRHFAFSTEQAYCHWAGRYYATHSREQIDALRQQMGHVSLARIFHTMNRLSSENIRFPRRGVGGKRLGRG